MGLLGRQAQQLVPGAGMPEGLQDATFGRQGSSREGCAEALEGPLAVKEVGAMTLVPVQGLGRRVRRRLRKSLHPRHSGRMEVVPPLPSALIHTWIE